jgi:hypothetical protein
MGHSILCGWSFYLVIPPGLTDMAVADASDPSGPACEAQPGAAQTRLGRTLLRCGVGAIHAHTRETIAAIFGSMRGCPKFTRGAVVRAISHMRRQPG